MPERRHPANRVNISQPRKRVPMEERKSESILESVYKRRRKGGSASYLEEATNLPSPSPGSPAAPLESNRVRSMATQLQAMFEGTDATHALRRQGSVHRTLPQSTDKCHLCAKRVYVVERICTEGLYFHRECFRCGTCSSPLRQGAHVFDSAQGKLYCKAHSVQHKNGTRLRSSFEKRTSSCGHQDSESPASHNNASPERPRHNSPSDGSRRSPSPQGTLTSLLRKGLSWPLSVTRSVCAAPGRLMGRLRRGSRVLGAHVRSHVPDYTYLYELLSVGLPLLLVLQEVLLQMYAEVAPTAGLSLRPLLLWLEEHVALGLS